MQMRECCVDPRARRTPRTRVQSVPARAFGKTLSPCPPSISFYFLLFWPYSAEGVFFPPYFWILRFDWLGVRLEGSSSPVPLCGARPCTVWIMISPDLHLPWSALFRDFHISRGVLYFYLYISFPDRDFSLFGLPPLVALLLSFFSLPRHQLCPGISIYPLSGGVQINGGGRGSHLKGNTAVLLFFFPMLMMGRF